MIKYLTVRTTRLFLLEKAILAGQFCTSVKSCSEKRTELTEAYRSRGVVKHDPER